LFDPFKEEFYLPPRSISTYPSKNHHHSARPFKEKRILDSANCS
jgi:hypothetical protein